MIGLKKGTVTIVPYDKEWTVLFKKEKSILVKALGPAAIDIQHVGSTSVPDMPAKPIVDIAVGIKTIKEFGQCFEPLKNAGYIYGPDASNWREFFFTKGRGEIITCHLHLMKYNGEIWKNYLAFRGYLRKNKDVARQYIILKETLARKYSGNRAKYTAAKSKFIRATIKTARNLPLSTP